MSALTSPTCFADSPALPSGFRDQAAGMSWPDVVQRFGTCTGPIRLGSWAASTRRAGQFTYDATFGIGDSIAQASATSYGPIDALTAMLHTSGFRFEILSFHQQPSGYDGGGEVATFVRCESDGRAEWAMALGSGSEESSLRAIITAANMLHG